MRLKKTSLIAAVAAVQLAIAAGAVQAETAPQRATISVTAEGRVNAAPDLATITMGVTSRGDTAAAALAANTAQLSAVLERLRAGGIAERDLQTTGLNLGPQFDYSRDGQPPRITGYEAGNMLTVRVRDLGNLGAILDQAVGDGANTFQGLNFGLSDPEPALDEARVRAVQEARRKAEMMAGAAGVKLGNIISMSESGGMPEGMPVLRMSAKADSGSAVPVAGGEVSYTVQVQVTWELAQ